MGRKASIKSSREDVNKGAWTIDEDNTLRDYIAAHGEGKWGRLPKIAGLKRKGKSCRLRWLNYLRPGIKRGNITQEEDDLIIRLHNLLGNKWSLIAGRLPGRTDNEIKNYWNTCLRKKANSLRPPSKFKHYEPIIATSMTHNNNNNNNNNKDDNNILVRPKAVRCVRVSVGPSTTHHSASTSELQVEEKKKKEEAMRVSRLSTEEEKQWWDILQGLEENNDTTLSLEGNFDLDELLEDWNDDDKSLESFLECDNWLGEC